MIRTIWMWTLIPTLIFSEVLINENFNTHYLIPDGWDANSIIIMGEGNYHHMAQISAVNDHLTSPSLNQPVSLDCIVYITGAGPNFVIKTSSDGDEYQAHSGSPFTIPPETRIPFHLELDPQITHIRFSKAGAGTIYLDDIIVSDSIPYAETVLLQAKQIEQNTTHNLIYASKVHNPSKVEVPLSQLNFEVLGTFTSDELEIAGFKVYQSNDLYISPDDKLLSTRGRCRSGEVLAFNLGSILPAQQTTYLLVTVGLMEYNYSQEIQHDLKINPIHEDGIFKSLTMGSKFTISQLSSIRDQFTDWNLSDWTHNGNFSIESPKIEGDGSSVYQNFATLATKDEVGHSVCVKSSPIAYGSWAFWIGEGNEWDTSGGNNYAVILMSDTNNLDDLNPLTEKFQGYFIKNDNYFSFCRQDGDTTHTLFTFGIPNEIASGDSTNKHGGYSFRITRDLTGKWIFFIDDNDCIPTTMRGTIVDNTYHDSVAFAVRTKINNPALKRKLYFDNMVLKSYSKPTINLEDRVNCYFESIGEQTYVKWISTYTEQILFKLFYLDPEQNWLEVKVTPQLNYGVYSINISEIVAEKWKLACEIKDQGQQEITLQGSKNQLLFTYQLQQGWNLVGPSGCQKFEESLPKNSERWTWQNSIYNRNLVCELTKGMWVQSEKIEDRTFVDSPTVDEPMLNLGWNLISFNSDFTYDFTILLLFYFQDGYYQILDGPVKPFQGYWVYRAK